MSEDKKFGKGDGEDAINPINQGEGDLRSEASEAFEKNSKEGENLGDKAHDKFEEAKEAAEDFAEKAKEKSKDFAEDTKKAASDFTNDAKKTANEFTEGAKQAFAGADGENKKLLAGLLALFLGWAGGHKFILGYQKEGIIMLAGSVIGWVTACFIIGYFLALAVWVVGVVEGIIYLTKSDEDFYNTYQVGKKPWF